MLISLNSYTNEKGVKLYSVSVDHSPVMPAQPSRDVALAQVSHWALRATMTGQKADMRRWDGDLGAETNLFPDMAAQGTREAYENHPR